MLNLVHLRTLSAVLRAGSFAAAGRTLGYTGSAVSQQMSTLERETGMRLFEREAHGIRPTPEAQFLSERAQEALGAVAGLNDAIVDMSSGTLGRLGLGSFPTASEALVPAAVATFGAAHPGVDVRFDDGEPDHLVPRLLEGDLDVIVVYHYELVPEPWPRGLARKSLFAEPLVMLVGDAYRGPVDEVPLTEFAEELWISTQEGTAGALAVERACANVGFAPRIRYRTNDYDVVRSFVRAGLGVAAVPLLGYTPSPGIRAIRASSLGIRRHVSVLSSLRRHSPAIDGMIQALAAAAALRPGA